MTVAGKTANREQSREPDTADIAQGAIAGTGPSLQALRERDPAALAQVVREHARSLYRLARAMGVAAADAEDVVQEVFVRFLEGLDRFAGRAQVRTWLCGILRNRLHEYWRERRTAPALDEGYDPEARFDARGGWRRPPADLQRLLESAEAATAIRGCMSDLEPRQREIFALREVEQLKVHEIGALLKITANHCGVLLHRARLRMRDCLERAGWGPAKP